MKYIFLLLFLFYMGCRNQSQEDSVLNNTELSNLNNASFTNEQLNYLLQDCKLHYALVQCLKNNIITTYNHNTSYPIPACAGFYSAIDKYKKSKHKGFRRELFTYMAKNYRSVYNEVTLIRGKAWQCSEKARSRSENPIQCVITVEESIINQYEKHFGFKCS